MKTIEIVYDPYRMNTKMLINGVDVNENDSYQKITEFIKNKTPLQTWIEPIAYIGWKGFVNETSDEERNDEVKIIFSGREIDFEDLKRSIEIQNNSRSERTSIKYYFEHKSRLDDNEMSKNIDEVVNELRSNRFRQLVRERSSDELKVNYDMLDKNYEIAKEREFEIVIAGVYSSGKSTLLNTLIRHNVLPMSSETCTMLNCRIKHDNSLGSKLSLRCYPEKKTEFVQETKHEKKKKHGKKKECEKKEYVKRIYNTDEQCAADFKKIVEEVKLGSAEKYIMELGVDLSHLYPNGISDDKFKIVLVDTPGTDSVESSKDGINKHAEMALNAIFDNSKPMIILCVDANTYQGKNIGEFMKQIVAEAQEGSGFNDRFLFLMNKCDSVKYNPGETAELKKNKFAKYLTDPSKWNISENEEELKRLAESASLFIPRVFLTAAGVAHAIQCKAFEFTDDEFAVDDDQQEMYESFEKKICIRKRTNYYLSNYCDIPNHRINEINKLFDDALNKKNYARATEMQCGILPVEYAIRDYIERYAYPIKVRGLLETFEAMLIDIEEFKKSSLKKMEQKKEALGEKVEERKEAGKRKEGINEKIEKLESIKDETDRQLEELDKVRFDSGSVGKVLADFQEKIEDDSEIKFIRSHPKVSTGQKTRDEVLNEISRICDHISKVFDSALKNTNKEMGRIKEKHDRQLLGIYGRLKGIVTQLKDSGVFEEGEYNFTNSVMWSMNFANIDFENLEEQIKQKVVDKTFYERNIPNFKKQEWTYSRNPLKKFFSLFMSDTERVVSQIDGYYETEAIVKSIAKYLLQLQRESDNMRQTFEAMTENSKKKVKDIARRLFTELDCFLKDIKKQEERLDKLSRNIDDLNTAIATNKQECEWLAGLEKKIKGENE